MVFNEMSALDIAYSKEVEEVFPNLKPSQINKICSNLSSKGYLHRLKRGIYLVQERPSTVPVIKNNTKLVPSGKAGGKYIKEWKVLDNLGKENILSWWYHG